jgi:hypothetical protein
MQLHLKNPLKHPLFGICSALLGAWLSMPACAPAATPPRFPVSLAAVAAAIAVQRPEISVSSLDVPPITASSPSPTLIVGALRPSGLRAIEVRIACRETADCLPFYVRVHGTQATQIGHAEPAPTARPAVAVRSQAPPAVHSGERVELHIDSGRLHINLPVISLASGRLGAVIRVTGLDRRMIYTARIVTPTLMEGSL